MLTKKQKRDYVKLPVMCPHCKSTNISAGQLATTSDEGEVTSCVNCLTCGKEWVDVYRVVDIREDEE